MHRLWIPLALLLLAGCRWTSQSVQARQGALDLRSADLARQVVRLDGEWLLLWQDRDTLYSRQPGSWVKASHHGQSLPAEGFATYQLRIRLPESHPRQLMLSTKEINARSRITVNGQGLPDIGNNRLYVRIEVPGDTLQLRIQVSNSLDINPGIPCPFYLGAIDSMCDRAQLYLGVQSFLIGIFAIFTVLYLIMWWSGRRKDFSHLLLALNSLVWMVYSFFQGVEASPAEILIPGLELVWRQKIYMLTTAISFTMTCVLWLQIFPSRLLRRSLPVLVVLSLVYGGLLCMIPQIHWQWYEWYLILGNSFLALLLWVVFQAALRKEPDAKVFLTGLLGMYAVLVYGTIIFRGEWMGFAALLLVLAEAFLLARRQVRSFETIARQNAELERVRQIKEELAEAVQEKFQHALQEERLASLLDLVEAPIVVYNDADRICYCNQKFCQLLRFGKEELQHMSWSALCVQEQEAENRQWVCTLRRSRGQHYVCGVRKSDFLIGADSLTGVFIQSSLPLEPAQSSKPQGDDPITQASPHGLACRVMQLSVDVWEASTGLAKADFAESTGLWKVNADPNGWRRTLTLDKYLDPDKIPQLPKWRKVLLTADFALMTAQHREWNNARVDELRELRQQLALQVG